jgi:phosphoribosylglycinamide formyltransferase 1
MPTPLRIAVLASGRGSNFAALLAARERGELPLDVVLVASDKADAGALQLAKMAAIPTLVLEPRDYPDRRDYDVALFERIAASKPDLLVLAGFMRIIDAAALKPWVGRMINIHPSLLPSFPGLHPQRQALAEGVKFSGCTVHFVRVAVDTGPIIAQAVVPVEDGDDEDRLAARILGAEHRLYPLAVRLFAEGRLSIDGNRVAIAGALPPNLALLNPTDR